MWDSETYEETEDTVLSSLFEAAQEGNSDSESEGGKGKRAKKSSKQDGKKGKKRRKSSAESACSESSVSVSSSSSSESKARPLVLFLWWVGHSKRHVFLNLDAGILNPCAREFISA